MAQEFMDDEIAASPVLDYGQHQSKEVGELVAALAKAQEAFTDPKKDKKGQYGMHATMAGVYEATRKHLNKNGIYVAVYKSADHSVGTVGVCVRLHKGEQHIGAFATTPIKADRQSYIWAQASGWTYLERYLLCGLTGVAPDDDDDGAGAANDANPNQADVKAQHQQQKRTTPAQAEAKSAHVPAKEPEGQEEPSAADNGETSTAMRSRFFGKTKELGWGMQAVSHLLAAMFHNNNTAKLTVEQLSKAIRVMEQGEPDEVLANLNQYNI